MSYCILSTSPPYLLLDSPPTVGIREHPVPQQPGGGLRRVGGEARLHGRVKAFRECEYKANRVIRVPLVVSPFQYDGKEV